MELHKGLTSGQVRERMEAGAYNVQPKNLTPSTGQIMRKNILTLFNLIHLALAALLVLVGHPTNILFLGIVFSNTALGVIQELRAKRTLDKLSILAKGKAVVIRDGSEMTIDPEEIVLEDIVRLSTGCQIYADAIVVDTDGLEADESLLTGESDNIRKKAGDTVMSGSFVTAGQAYVQVTAVGSDNYATALTVEAKKEKNVKSPLMRTLNLIIRTLTFIIVPLGALLFYRQYAASGWDLPEAVLGASAAMLGMIPQGLILLTGVTLTVGAVNLARRKALVQSLFSIETLARVDVLCLDKTGTITDGTLSFERLIPMEGYDEEAAEQAMETLMGASKDDNSTAAALREKFGKQPHKSIVSENESAPHAAGNDIRPLASNQSSMAAKQTAAVPFSSARKWSGVSFESEGSLVLGAPRFVFPEKPGSFFEIAENWTAQGYRVLCLAVSDEQLKDDKLPGDLRCIALILLSDTVRSDAPDTFRYFADEGVTLKVISGDDPLTVSTVASKAGIEGADRYVDMSDFADEGDFTRLVEENTVFGRVSPHQKRELIRALKSNGHTTCMTGDGVNDVLAMKESDCSVAMVGGSDAARGVCDFVLMTSSFSAMVNVLKEGRRVINNIELVSSLYLVQTIYSVIFSVLYIFLPYSYPYVPLQMTPVNGLTVGLPTFFLALRANYKRPRGEFLANILEISAPAAFIVVFNTLIVQLVPGIFHLPSSDSATITVFLVGLVGFLLLIKVSRPLTARLAAMLIFICAAFALLFTVFRGVFRLESLFTQNSLYYLPLLFTSILMLHFLSRMMHKVYERRGAT